MSQLPSLRGAQLIRALERAGFYVHHSKGSHRSLRHRSKTHLRVTVPIHNVDLKVGTLHAILAQAELSVQELLNLL
jgi:predicted RNA binding protein YcfA (HicA-like mRNA interferase family)